MISGARFAFASASASSRAARALRAASSFSARWRADSYSRAPTAPSRASARERALMCGSAVGPWRLFSFSILRSRRARESWYSRSAAAQPVRSAVDDEAADASDSGGGDAAAGGDQTRAAAGGDGCGGDVASGAASSAARRSASARTDERDPNSSRRWMSADAESSSAADCVLCLDVCCDWMNSAQTSAIVRGSLRIAGCLRSSADCARLA